MAASALCSKWVGTTSARFAWVVACLCYAIGFVRATSQTFAPNNTWNLLEYSTPLWTCEHFTHSFHENISPTSYQHPPAIFTIHNSQSPCRLKYRGFVQLRTGSLGDFGPSTPLPQALVGLVQRRCSDLMRYGNVCSCWADEVRVGWFATEPDQDWHQSWDLVGQINKHVSNTELNRLHHVGPSRRYFLVPARWVYTSYSYLDFSTCCFFLFRWPGFMDEQAEIHHYWSRYEGLGDNKDHLSFAPSSTADSVQGGDETNESRRIPGLRLRPPGRKETKTQ